MEVACGRPVTSSRRGLPSTAESCGIEGALSLRAVWSAGVERDTTGDVIQQRRMRALAHDRNRARRARRPRRLDRARRQRQRDDRRPDRRLSEERRLPTHRRQRLALPPVGACRHLEHPRSGRRERPGWPRRATRASWVSGISWACRSEGRAGTARNARSSGSARALWAAGCSGTARLPGRARRRRVARPPRACRNCWARWTGRSTRPGFALRALRNGVHTGGWIRWSDRGRDLGFQRHRASLQLGKPIAASSASSATTSSSAATTTSASSSAGLEPRHQRDRLRPGRGRRDGIRRDQERRCICGDARRDRARARKRR